MTDEEIYEQYMAKKEQEDAERFKAEDDEIEENYCKLKEFYGDMW